MTQIYSLLKKLKNKKEKNWNISWNLGMFLTNLVEINKPNKILEVGTSNGFSTLCLLKNLPETSKIYTVEINEERFLKAKKNFENFEKNIFQIKGNILEILENNSLKKKFDLIFIDARQDEYKKILQLIEKNQILNENSIIVFDNILTHESTKPLVDFVKKKYVYEIIEMDSGFLILKN